MARDRIAGRIWKPAKRRLRSGRFAGLVRRRLLVLVGLGRLSGLLERYRTSHAGAIVWTKLDEAEHYGQIVNVALATNLPVSALSFGPGLGNSLAPVRESMLWRLLFKRELPTGL